MDLALNVLILVVGSIGSLSALMGDTWRKGNAPLFRKLTPAGWFSLASLVLALAIGVYKEMRDGRAAAEQEATVGRQQKDLSEASASLSQMDSILEGLLEKVAGLKEACTRIASGETSPGAVAPASPGGVHAAGTDLMARRQLDQEFRAISDAIRKVRPKLLSRTFP
jgi:hypothetical protein